MSSVKLQLVAGLGNPGAQYKKTRHNIGSAFLDKLVAGAGLSFENKPRFYGEVARTKGMAGDLWLLHPMSFMNRSGLAVAAMANFYKFEPESILVVHDELDLEPGQIRLKLGGGYAGHNGLKDIAARLGSANFWRLRLGIGHPHRLNLRQAVADFVLQRPSESQAQLLDTALQRTLEAWPQLAHGDVAAAQRLLHSPR